METTCDLKSDDVYIQHIETCDESSFVLTNTGEVFSFGKNKKGNITLC